MSNKSIGKTVRKTSSLSRNLESVTFNSVRKALPDKAILDACGQVSHVYRNSLISPIVTVLHMIIAAIWPEDSFNASWHLSWASFAAISDLPCEPVRTGSS